MKVRLDPRDPEAPEWVVMMKHKGEYKIAHMANTCVELLKEMNAEQEKLKESTKEEK